MPWNSGNYTRIHDWSADAAAGIDILASRMDEDADDIADGINSCLNLDNENYPHTDIRMNNQKWLDCGDPELHNQFATAGIVQFGELNYAGYAAAPDSVINAYVVSASDNTDLPQMGDGANWKTGMRVCFFVSSGLTNTGESTLSVNNSAALPIVCNGAPLLGGEIREGTMVEVMWGTGAWSLMSPSMPQDLSNFSRISCRAFLANSTSPFSIYSGSIDPIQWETIDWDDAGYMDPLTTPAAPTSDITIPQMEYGETAARFRITANLVFQTVVAADQDIFCLRSIIKIGTQEPRGGWGNIILAGNLSGAIGSIFVARSVLDIELAPGDVITIKALATTHDSAATDTVRLLGSASMADHSWVSVRRFG